MWSVHSKNKCHLRADYATHTAIYAIGGLIGGILGTSLAILNTKLNPNIVTNVNVTHLCDSLLYMTFVTVGVHLLSSRCWVIALTQAFNI